MSANQPRLDEPPSAPSPQQVAAFEALLICYRSEQMSTAQLRQHMADDPHFEAYVLANLRQQQGDG